MRGSMEAELLLQDFLGIIYHGSEILKFACLLERHKKSKGRHKFIYIS